MARHRDYVFVLWADQFEEAPATIFVTELREAGLRVKVVGATPAPISGLHGLALVPDLTLDQALTLLAQVICLIIPQTGRGYLR
ncbi:MAG: DJ-1/PfpI family protein [Anaerolineales bacterium]|nr:DJ-1/PfpI family protein [Anaerolineales bacterium]